MKTSLVAALSLCLTVSFTHAADEPAFKTDKEKASYSIGVDIGTKFKTGGLDAGMIDFAAVAAGMKDGLTTNQFKLTEQEMMAAMQIVQKEITARRSAAGTKFFAENAKKEGVKTTASGLQYKVIKEGTGKTPKDGDTVVTHYRGTLLDGTEFDSSYKRNQPAKFPINRVIPGWTEALKLMKEGAKWQLFIPSNLGYGPQGTRGIPPDSTLIFDVELISIEAVAKP